MDMTRFVPLLASALALLACSPRNGLIPPDGLGDDDDTPPPEGCTFENEWPDQLEQYAGYEGTGADVGDLVPDFALVDQNDDTFCMSQLFGAALVLDFSTIWCGPCNDAAEEAPELLAAARQIGPTWFVNVMTQNAAGAPASHADVVWWAENYGLEFPVGLDASEAVADAYGLTGYPLFMFIAPNGEIVERHENKPSDAEVLDFIETAIEDYADSLRP
jgi:peroxiredoxin